MWKAYLSRRQLLEQLLSDRIIDAAFDDGKKIRKEPSLDADQLIVFWRRDPSQEPELPNLIVAPDAKISEILALFGSTPQLPSPITAFCRVVSETDFREMSNFEAGFKERILDGFVGMAISEVVIVSNGNLRFNDVGPAACKRSLSYTFGKALLNCSAHFLPVAVDGWYKVQKLVNPQGNVDLMNQVGVGSTAIFNVACEVFYGLPPTTNLSEACYEILELGEPSDHVWSKLKSPTSTHPSLKILGESAREERGLYLQDALKGLANLKSGGSDEEVAFCALLATRIAPGSFEHMNMLASFPNRRVLLWYGFFAALQRRGSALKGNGGLGLRVRRDLFRVSSLSELPLADISLAELTVASRSGFDSLSKKLGHSNEIVVEICPLLEGSFRFGFKQDKVFETVETIQQQTKIPFSDSDREMSLVDKLDLVRKLLAEITAGVKNVQASSAKTKAVTRKK